jgi:Fe-S-cluster-containing dehydrogenase component
MQAKLTRMPRPQRWHDPFDGEMDQQKTEAILQFAPFSSMDPARFPKSTPLSGIIQYDCRWLELHKGDIVVREGDYGNSAFLILSGEVLVSLKSLPAALLGRVQQKRKTLFQSLSQLWSNHRHAEVRDYCGSPQETTSLRQNRAGTRVFLHDIPRVISAEHAESMFAGEIFGEISALTRTPRSATVVANRDSVLVEIRWQGLRELMKYDPALQAHVENRYRKNSLKAHLREVDLFRQLNPEQLSALAAETTFESYGEFRWNIDYRSTRAKDVAARILDEPVIVNEGDYINGLYLIRNGFVRVCRRHGSGIQTVAYMGRGGAFGIRELMNNWQTGEQRPWTLSLRAVGYVDLLRVPVQAVEKHALAHRFQRITGASPIPTETDRQNDRERRQKKRGPEMNRGLLEFLVEERFINGKKAMMIDLDRCTRCDDCVRACAATHDNNPRFNRQGPVYDRYMIATACMHCCDPVCMIGCPTGAIARDVNTGNVTINDNTCIGCATCANSCPYQNIRMVEINDVQGQKIVDAATQEPILKATKCDFCVDQLAGPACQRACPHDALIRIDLTEPSAVTRWTQV